MDRHFRGAKGDTCFLAGPKVMNEVKTMLATMLAVLPCIVGIALVLFELAILGSEWNLFLTGGWRVFLVFVAIGVAMFAGGVSILFRKGNRS